MSFGGLPSNNVQLPTKNGITRLHVCRDASGRACTEETFWCFLVNDIPKIFDCFNLALLVRDSFCEHRPGILGRTVGYPFSVRPYCSGLLWCPSPWSGCLPISARPSCGFASKFQFYPNISPMLIRVFPPLPNSWPNSSFLPSALRWEQAPPAGKRTLSGHFWESCLSALRIQVNIGVAVSTRRGNTIPQNINLISTILSSMKRRKQTIER